MQAINLRIGDRSYSMFRMTPLKGAAFGLKVSSVVAKILSGNSIQSLREIEGKIQENISEDDKLTVGSLVSSALSNVDPKLVFDILKEALLNEVYFDNVRFENDGDLDIHFEKYPQDFYVVGAWAAFNHVKPFFTGLGDGLRALIPNSETSSQKA